MKHTIKRFSEAYAESLAYTLNLGSDSQFLACHDPVRGDSSVKEFKDGQFVKYYGEEHED